MTDRALSTPMPIDQPALTPRPRLDPVFVDLRKRDRAASRGAAGSISDVWHLAKICQSKEQGHISFGGDPNTVSIEHSASDGSRFQTVGSASLPLWLDQQLERVSFPKLANSVQASPGMGWNRLVLPMPTGMYPRRRI